MKLAYLGDKHSYSYRAALAISDCERVAYPTIAAVVAAVKCGEVDAAIAPIENNVAGVVNETIDAIAAQNLYITKELSIPVSHKLIALSGTKLSAVTRVLSKYEAIAQCRDYLEKGGFATVTCPSTSDALRRLDGNSAAIASEPLDGQTVLAQDIQDNKNNKTRFVLIRPQPEFNGDKMSVAFKVPNESGALLKVLEAIYEKKLNMSRIVSRPLKSGNGEYLFFVDFASVAFEKDVAIDALNHIATVCDLQFLGKY